MVLIVTPAKGAATWVPAIERATGERVQVSPGLDEAVQRLRAADFTLVVVDQACLDGSATGADLLWKHTGMAMPMVVNMAVSGAQRLAREVRAGLIRHRQERQQAVRAAEESLRNELNGAVTGILLSSEIALAQPALPPQVVSKLKNVHELALQIRNRLGSAA